MSVVLAVLLCRLFVTCAGVLAGFVSEGVCSTAVAVASLISLLASLPHPVCSLPASRARFSMVHDYRSWFFPGSTCMHVLNNTGVTPYRYRYSRNHSFFDVHP